MKLSSFVKGLGFTSLASCLALLGPAISFVGPKIWLGERAPPGADPWQVAILIKNAEDEGVWCGGSILDEQTVATAAHCLEDQSGTYYADDLVVLEGTVDVTSYSGRWLDVDRAVIHRSYDLSTVDNDIALLRVAGSLTSEPISFVSPEEEPNFIKSGFPARVTGWGRTEFAEYGVDRLRSAVVEIVARETCNSPDAYNGLVTQNMICAGKEYDSVQNIDSCSGDSGGPLTVNKGGSRLQIGIVSWGGRELDDGIAPCGQPNLVGVYTRVANYSEAVLDCLARDLRLDGLCGGAFAQHLRPS